MIDTPAKSWQDFFIPDHRSTIIAACKENVDDIIDDLKKAGHFKGAFNWPPYPYDKMSRLLDYLNDNSRNEKLLNDFGNAMKNQPSLAHLLRTDPPLESTSSKFSSAKAGTTGSRAPVAFPHEVVMTNEAKSAHVATTALASTNELSTTKGARPNCHTINVPTIFLLSSPHMWCSKRDACRQGHCRSKTWRHLG